MAVLIKVTPTAEINTEHSLSGFYIFLYGLQVLSRIIKLSIYYRTVTFSNLSYASSYRSLTKKWGEVLETCTNNNLNETT